MLKNSNIDKFIRHHNVFRLVIAYIFVFALGTVLLKLPIVLNEGYEESWLDAFFMAASSLSGTGLATFDYINGYNYLGWIIMIIFVNIGSVGIIVFNTAILLLIGTKLNIRRLNQIQLDFNQQGVLNVKDIIINVVKYFLIIELVGTILLFCRMGDIFIDPVERFMNALLLASSCIGASGFYDATIISGDPIAIWICNVLMVYSFIGHPVVLELRNYLHAKKEGKRYRFSTFCRISLCVNIITVLLFVIAFLLLEGNNIMAGYSPIDKFNAAFFMSFSTKSVGLTLFPSMALMLPLTLFIQTFFMLVGAAPSSCGGGIKTNAIYLFFAYVRNLFKGEDEVIINNRKVASRTIKLALVLILMFLGISLMATIVISFLNPSIDILSIWYEVVSGFTTSGFSVGVLTQIGEASQAIIALLMIIGRIGILNIIFFLNHNNNKKRVHYPDINIAI